MVAVAGALFVGIGVAEIVFYDYSLLRELWLTLGIVAILVVYFLWRFAKRNANPS